MKMPGHYEMHRCGAAIAAVLCLTAAGCGTSSNSLSSSSAGTIQQQSQPARGPILGYVWDASGQALRPVKGVPGASVIGAAVTSSPGGASIVATASSAVSGMAVFLDANGNVFQSPLAGGSLSKIASLPGAKTLVLSNSGAYALVTGSNASGVNNASVISGLPQTPSVATLNLSGLTTLVKGVASDTGTVALAASASSDPKAQVSVVAFAGKATGASVATLESFGGMQFVPGSDELVVADATSGAITAVSHVNTAPSSAALPAGGSITAPASLDITSDGRWVIAANQTGDVLRLDLNGVTAATKLHCSCAPSQVLALSGTTMRLVTSGGGPLWIVDAGVAAPRVLFIPAMNAGSVPTVTTRSSL